LSSDSALPLAPCLASRGRSPRCARRSVAAIPRRRRSRRPAPAGRPILKRAGKIRVCHHHHLHHVLRNSILNKTERNLGNAIIQNMPEGREGGAFTPYWSFSGQRVRTARVKVDQRHHVAWRFTPYQGERSIAFRIEAV